MRYHVDLDQPTATFLRHMHPFQKQKIKACLDDIAENPTAGKMLQKELAGLYSYRVGRYRIIYIVNDAKKEVNVIAIGPRESIYVSRM